MVKIYSITFYCIYEEIAVNKSHKLVFQKRMLPTLYENTLFLGMQTHT